jgi:hypothetical protein
MEIINLEKQLQSDAVKQSKAQQYAIQKKLAMARAETIRLARSQAANKENSVH